MTPSDDFVAHSRRVSNGTWTRNFIWQLAARSGRADDDARRRRQSRRLAKRQSHDVGGPGLNERSPEWSPPCQAPTMARVCYDDAAHRLAQFPCITPKEGQWRTTASTALRRQSVAGPRGAWPSGREPSSLDSPGCAVTFRLLRRPEVTSAERWSRTRSSASTAACLPNAAAPRIASAFRPRVTMYDVRPASSHRMTALGRTSAASAVPAAGGNSARKSSRAVTTEPGGSVCAHALPDRNLLTLRAMPSRGWRGRPPLSDRESGSNLSGLPDITGSEGGALRVEPGWPWAMDGGRPRSDGRAL